MTRIGEESWGWSSAGSVGRIVGWQSPDRQRNRRWRRIAASWAAVLVGGAIIVVFGGLYSAGGTQGSNGQPAPVFGGIVVAIGIVVIVTGVALCVVRQIDNRRERSG